MKTVKLNTNSLRKIIYESLGMNKFMSKSDAYDYIMSMNSNDISQHNIVDEDTGEFYVSAGESYGSSSLLLSNKRKNDFKSFDDDDDVIENEFSSAESEYNQALRDYSSNWVDFNSNDTLSIEDVAIDAADGFFMNIHSGKNGQQ